MNFWPWLRRNVIYAFVVGVFLVPTLWWIMDREPPYEHDYGTITPAMPKEGDQITIEWKMKKINRVCDGWVQRQIYDKDNALTCNYDIQPAIRSDQLKRQQEGSGELGSLSRAFTLCSKATAGPARYRAYTCYQCNPLQKFVPQIAWPICLYTPDVPFTIGPADRPAQGP